VFILSLGPNTRRSNPLGRLGTLQFTNKWCMTDAENAENQQKWSDSFMRAGPFN